MWVKVMIKRIVAGFIFSISIDLIIASILYIGIIRRANPEITCLDVIKVVAIAILLITVFNIYIFFVAKIGQGRRIGNVLRILFAAGCVALIFYSIRALSDYYAAFILLILIPFLITCFVWLKIPI